MTVSELTRPRWRYLNDVHIIVFHFIVLHVIAAHVIIKYKNIPDLSVHLSGTLDKAHFQQRISQTKIA
jgi:hypothetical protein